VKEKNAAVAPLVEHVIRKGVATFRKTTALQSVTVFQETTFQGYSLVGGDVWFSAHPVLGAGAEATAKHR
jgi:hypothetical protein